MLTIHLKDIAFHAHHGVYEAEKQIGNKFVVNVHVHFLPETDVIMQLQQTINYENLFQLVRQRMMIATPLLETIVMELCNSIMEQFTQVRAVYVGIEKLSPPIELLQGSVVVSYQLSRKSMNDEG